MSIRIMWLLPFRFVGVLIIRALLSGSLLGRPGFNEPVRTSLGRLHWPRL